jgi:hypothetical protein
MYKIRIKMLEPSNSKLHLVKTLKDLSDLGLREAKNIVDDLHSGLTTQVFLKKREDVNILKKSFNEWGKFTITGGVEYERNIQLLSLELGENQEYVDEISDRIFFQLDDETSKLLLNFALSKLSRQQLIQLFNESNSFIING